MCIYTCSGYDGRTCLRFYRGIKNECLLKCGRNECFLNYVPSVVVSTAYTNRRDYIIIIQMISKHISLVYTLYYRWIPAATPVRLYKLTIPAAIKNYKI